VQARIEGPLLDGQVRTGHEVELRGRTRHGVFVADSGVNLTTGAAISVPGSRWRFAFIAMSIIVLVEYGFLAFLLAPSIIAGR
jgi:hypothetical protein